MGRGKTITQTQVNIMNRLAELNVPQNIIAEAMGISPASVSRHTVKECTVVVEADPVNEMEKIREEIRSLMTRKTELNGELDSLSAQKEEINQRFSDLVAEKRKINERLNVLYDLKQQAEVEHVDC